MQARSPLRCQQQSAQLLNHPLVCPACCTAWCTGCRLARLRDVIAAGYSAQPIPGTAAWKAVQTVQTAETLVWQAAIWKRSHREDKFYQPGPFAPKCSWRLGQAFWDPDPLTVEEELRFEVYCRYSSNESALLAHMAK